MSDGNLRTRTARKRDTSPAVRRIRRIQDGEQAITAGRAALVTLSAAAAMCTAMVLLAIKFNIPAV